MIYQEKVVKIINPRIDTPSGELTNKAFNHSVLVVTDPQRGTCFICKSYLMIPLIRLISMFMLLCYSRESNAAHNMDVY